MLVQMELASFGIDPGKNTPVILLKEVGGQRTLAVLIGPFEASTIAANSLGVAAERPQVLDLTKLIIETLGGTLQRVVVDEGSMEGSLLGRLHLARRSNLFVVDCAASHAIVLALRCSAPIFVHEGFLQKRQEAETPSPADMLRRHISSLDTVDFGRYFLE